MSYEFSLWMDQLMQSKWFGEYVRKDPRYERLVSLRMLHSLYIVESPITGYINVSLFNPVILFSISSLHKYVPHTFLGFLPEHTQEATPFEDLTSLHSVLMLPFCILISSLFFGQKFYCALFCLLMVFCNWANYDFFIANTIRKSKQHFSLVVKIGVPVLRWWAGLSAIGLKGNLSAA